MRLMTNSNVLLCLAVILTQYMFFCGGITDTKYLQNIVIKVLLFFVFR